MIVRRNNKNMFQYDRIYKRVANMCEGTAFHFYYGVVKLS